MWSLAAEESVLQNMTNKRCVLQDKNVPRSKITLLLITLELDQRREQQNHVPALVHDRTVAEGTADLAGQLVLGGFGGRVVPLEVVVAVFEVDVVFVEDGGPLERCSWKRELAFSISSMAVIFLLIKRTYHVGSGKWCSGIVCCPEAPLC